MADEIKEQNVEKEGMNMDYTIQTIASEIVDKYGDRFTEEMVSNMQAQYGITDTSETTES